jgi:arylsulfatase
MATLLEITGVEYPERRDGVVVEPAAGVSMLRSWRGEAVDPDRALYFEHEGNGAIRVGRWKLVRKHAQPWELFDLAADRSELVDLAAQHPGRVAELAVRYESWASEHGVKPRDPILAANKGGPAPLIRPYASSRPRG